MIILGLDTCLDACSVAVLEDGRVRAQASHPMGRGHQEAIAPLAEQVMAEAGLAFADLDRIGVTIGPGSFTGLRVGLAFAKGLGAALSRPVVGVGTLAALAEPLGDDLTFAAIDARRGQIYLQAFAGGRALMAPDALDVATAAARVAELSGGRAAVLVGSGASLLADLMRGARQVEAPACDPAAVARLAAAQTNPPSPRPLYLRAPDARLPGGAPGPDMT
jgi:tRNA threonylcarbamoyladenosine biosynthesis protein TsaB